jgi:enoyl-CoA hydratase/carnithine racemase
MITQKFYEKVALVKLDRGVTNAIHLNLVEKLSEAFKYLKHDTEVYALVLGSSNDRFFSIGFDILSLFERSREDFAAFYQAFNRLCLELYTFPKPTVAAISGHAIAGGCILALCCDYRFISEGHKLIGLNEVKLGVPVPYPADCILRQVVGARHAREVMEEGEFYPPEQAYEIGLVDQILPLEEILPAAIEKASKLGALPQQAYTLIKRNRVESISALIRAKLAEKERLFVERWYSPDARERLQAAIEKF